MADERHLHVLGHRHGHEGLRYLERASDAQPPDAARGETGDVLAGQYHAAAVWLELASHHVEDRRLAGAVWADHRQQRARLERERDVARGDDAAERLRQGLGAEEAHGPLPTLARAASAPRRRPSLARSTSAPPTRPRGMASTIAMMASPSSS